MVAFTPTPAPRTSSLSTGVDYRWTSDAIIGIAGNATDIGCGSQTSSDALNLTLYGTMRPVDAAYIDAQFSYDMVKFDARRNVATIDVIAEGKPNGEQIWGTLTGGREFDTGPFTYGP